MARRASSCSSDIAAYLTAHERSGLLRFITCGSVDDGKSTLIGRLLYESELLFEDQLRGARGGLAQRRHAGRRARLRAAARRARRPSASRGSRSTSPTATSRPSERKFIVADTPGHEQYTRNMVTGASTADCAVILIDARKGVLTQTRRHTYLVSLLGIRHVALAINKLDLVDYSRGPVRARSRREYRAFAARLGLEDVTCIPVSALRGDNVVEPEPADALVRAGRR